MNTDNKSNIVVSLPEKNMARTSVKNESKRYLTISEYLDAVFKATGEKIAPSTLLNRRDKKEIQFVVVGDPIYKIDTKKFPPAKFSKKTRGRKAYKSK